MSDHRDDEMHNRMEDIDDFLTEYGFDIEPEELPSIEWWAAHNNESRQALPEDEAKVQSDNDSVGNNSRAEAEPVGGFHAERTVLAKSSGSDDFLEGEILPDVKINTNPEPVAPPTVVRAEVHPSSLLDYEVSYAANAANLEQENEPEPVDDMLLASYSHQQHSQNRLAGLGADEFAKHAEDSTFSETRDTGSGITTLSDHQHIAAPRAVLDKDRLQARQKKRKDAAGQEEATFPGLTAGQRLFLSLLFFLNAVIFGIIFLILTESIVIG